MPKEKEILLPHDHGSTLKQVLKDKPSDISFAEVSSTFALTSDASRLKILWILCHCEECVINIAAAVEMSSPAVSHHLRLLKQSGLITSKKEGKEVYYSLATTEDAQLVHRIIDATFERK